MNTKFTVFDRETGQVLFGGTASNASVFESDVQKVLIGQEHTSGYFDANLVHHSQLPQPSPSHVFNWSTKQWVLDFEKAVNLIKHQRKLLLAQSDWVVVKAQETGTAVPEVWLNYRQALRDITLQADPLKIVWPVQPG